MFPQASLSSDIPHLDVAHTPSQVPRSLYQCFACPSPCSATGAFSCFLSFQMCIGWLRLFSRLGMLEVIAQVDNRDRHSTSPYLCSLSVNVINCMMYSFICMGYCFVVCMFYAFSSSAGRTMTIVCFESGCCEMGCVLYVSSATRTTDFFPPALTRSASSKPRELCEGLPASLTSPL